MTVHSISGRRMLAVALWSATTATDGKREGELASHVARLQSSSTAERRPSIS